MADNKFSWLGKIRGHVSQSQANVKEYVEQRAQAEAEGRILTRREVQGEWDASRVLWTTLGGQIRPLTANDIATFRHNVRQVSGKYKGGIKARQVIDLASGKPLNYVSNQINGGARLKYRSDIDKAKGEIRTAIPVSSVNGVVRFLTNAGPDSKVTRHTVTIELMGWTSALGELAGVKLGDTKAVRTVANRMRKGYLKFDCDCERHRYFFRYLASTGGYAYGKQETGYPKIRNPHLIGCACKHVLRVMAELESSGTCLNFLTKALERANSSTPRTTLTQREAEEALKKQKSATRIKTSAQRRAEADKAADRRAAKKGQEKKVRRPKRISPAMRKYIKAIAALEKVMGKNEVPEDVKKRIAESLGVTI